MLEKELRGHHLTNDNVFRKKNPNKRNLILPLSLD